MEEEKTMEMNTVPAMFWHGVTTRAGKAIFRQKDFGIWKSVTWDELGRIAREIGMGLASLGYQPGEVVSILANTRKEWVYADLGALGAAGVVNGIYPTDAPAQAEYAQDGRLLSLEQHGWRVEYLAYEGARPTRLKLNYPGLELRLAIGEWK